MHFGELHTRLVGALQSRLRNGELTERRLARLTGISQPHIHNVLNGKRILSQHFADIILSKTNLTVLDLLQPEGAAGTGCRNGDNLLVEVPVLNEWLGPGLPLPVSWSALDRHPWPANRLAPVERPLVARLAADPQMATLFGEADLALLDQSSARRTHLCEDALYVVNRRGEGLIRYATLERADLLVLRWATGDELERTEALPLGQSDLLDVVRARVPWILRSFDLG